MPASALTANASQPRNTRHTLHPYPQKPRHSFPIDRLPPELRNTLYDTALTADDIAIILPRSQTLISKLRLPSGGQIQEDMLITSPNQLHRIGKTTRSEYYLVFKAHALALDVSKVVVHVEDFNFASFTGCFLDRLSVGARQKLGNVEFEVRLSFTEDFLLRPDEAPLEAFLAYCSHAAKEGRAVPALTWFIETMKTDTRYEMEMRTYLNNFFFAGRDEVEFHGIISVVKKHFGLAEVPHFRKRELFEADGYEYWEDDLDFEGP